MGVKSNFMYIITTVPTKIKKLKKKRKELKIDVVLLEAEFYPELEYATTFNFIIVYFMLFG